MCNRVVCASLFAFENALWNAVNLLYAYWSDEFSVTHVYQTEITALLRWWRFTFFFCLSLGCRKKKGDNEKNLIHEPRAWQSINLSVNSGMQPMQNLEFLRAQINQSFFMESIILFCWAIWMSRDTQISHLLFKGVKQFSELSSYAG